MSNPINNPHLIQYLPFNNWMEKLARMNPDTKHHITLVQSHISCMRPFVSFPLLQEYYITFPPSNFHFYHVFHNGLAYTNWPVRGCKEVTVMQNIREVGEVHDMDDKTLSREHEERAQTVDRWLTDDSSRWQYVVQFGEFIKWVFLVMPKLRGEVDLYSLFKNMVR